MKILVYGKGPREAYNDLYLELRSLLMANNVIFSAKPALYGYDIVVNFYKFNISIDIRCCPIDRLRGLKYDYFYCSEIRGLTGGVLYAVGKTRVYSLEDIVKLVLDTKKYFYTTPLNRIGEQLSKGLKDGVEVMKRDLFDNAWLYPNSVHRNALITNVIFNDPATIVFWTDGTKTVVKADDEPFDPEKGLAMAICKKTLGNEGNYYNIFKKWLPDDKEEK